MHSQRKKNQEKNKIYGEAINKPGSCKEDQRGCYMFSYGSANSCTSISAKVIKMLLYAMSLLQIVFADCWYILHGPMFLFSMLVDYKQKSFSDAVLLQHFLFMYVLT